MAADAQGMSERIECDGCSARARLVAVKGQALLAFCSHHGAAHLQRLASDGWTVRDLDRDGSEDKVNA
jgi:hypothetical protein